MPVKLSGPQQCKTQTEDMVRLYGVYLIDGNQSLES